MIQVLDTPFVTSMTAWIESFSCTWKESLSQMIIHNDVPYGEGSLNEMASSLE